MTYVRTAWNRRSWWTAALALAAAACGGDDDGGTTAPTPTIGVTVGSPTLSVTAGQSGTAAVTVSRGGGYTGAVNLTVEGTIPAGTATANPTSLANGVTASTVTVTTGSATPAGTYNLTVRAAGTGAVAAVTAPLTVTVTAAAPAAGFTIAPAAALTVTQGAAAQNATINITRTGGFAGAVTLATAGTIPAGLTVTPAAATTGNSATVAVTATSAVAPGTYPITINATGAGATGTQTTTLNVTVQAAAAAGDFTVSAANVSVQQGASAGNAVVTITRTGGYTGGVTLTTSAAPAGLTIAAPTAPVTEGTANIAVTAGNGSTPGTYPVTVTATGAGITGSKTTTFNVTVTPPVTVGNYTLGTTGNVTVQQGASATTTLNVTRTGGFAGGVQVAATGAPAGVTVTVAPNPVTANTATVTVAATGTAATGNATVTLTGTSAGVANQTTTFTVNVTPASTGGGGNVSYAFCAPDLPVWVAYQDGNGAWTRATAGANNTYAFNIASRGGVAYVTQFGSTYDLTVQYGTTAELVAVGQQRCGTFARGTKRLTGTVTGLGAAAGGAIVSLGPVSEFAFGSPQFTLDSVPDGPLNLVASRLTFDIASGSIGADRIVIRRGVNYANGSAIPTIDFASSEAFAPATATLTVAGAGTDSVAVVTAFVAGRFSFEGIAGGFFLNTGTSPLRYGGVPADRLQAGELHSVFASAGDPERASGQRGAGTFVRTITDRTVTLGPSPSTVTVTSAATAPYLRLRATAASQAAYNGGASLSASQSDRSADVSVTPSYLGGAPANWELVIPDLTAAGFDANWGLRAGTQTSWSFSTFGGNLLALLGGTPSEGTTYQFAQRSGTVGGSLRSLSYRRAAAEPAPVAALRQHAARLGRSVRALAETRMKR